jgi:hypothetical protein
MFGRDVEFIGDSRVAGEGFEWDVSDHECCFEKFGAVEMRVWESIFELRVGGKWEGES